MRTELISIPTPTHPLDAAYYTPDGPSKGAVMYCHGNQMNFYVCAARFLAPHITALGYDFMPFNRRGHDSVSTCDSREASAAPIRPSPKESKTMQSRQITWQSADLRIRS